MNTTPPPRFARPPQGGDTSGPATPVSRRPLARALPPSRIALWGGFALLLAIAPLIWGSGLGLTVLSQMGIAIIACLSYNMLLGQGGMLSFGHAVYTGLGSFMAIHALNQVTEGAMQMPVSLIPIVGGLAGLFFAVLFGYVTTRKSGTTFAMITLGLGELVFALSLMIPEFFGGEGGVSGDRMAGEPFMGITFGPQRQVYYLIAVYTFVCVALMYAFTRTPLGRMLNAVRDNPERVEFVGYDTQKVRYLAFIIAGFFAGISGGLAALNFEIVTAEVVGAARSGAYLLFTFLGGATFFFGPIIGGVLMVLALILLSELTKAWLLYLGLIFLFMVMYAPGGIAALIMMNVRVAAYGRLRELTGSYLALFAATVVMLVGAAAIIEMVYHLQLSTTLGDELNFLGLTLHARGWASWIGAVLVAGVGFALFELTRKRFARRWGAIQEDIENQIKQKEAP
ncbi:MAG TPA: branched-chain amino acid ABC transporter permease [Hydrogenophaga sp.]|uniref:branched-chain amino acid ABC transporter permease n=1 Tax=Hydrogenophaga sp. TaxID=1904254 RepID=UPI002B79E934|nr:branched-chain amino acid ABC transporter permease [Hydrogenophaga sp.]HSX94637.1 branched-chain amino acid ABC transporter permease [Hydrogenophaga sp.]